MLTYWQQDGGSQEVEEIVHHSHGKSSAQLNAFKIKSLYTVCCGSGSFIFHAAHRVRI
jgi:hypothetical protein